MARRWTIKEEQEKREELSTLYIDQNKTIKEVAQILQIGESSVFDRLKRLNIPSIPKRKLCYLNKNKLIAPDFSKELAEFLGVMLGDGHIANSQNARSKQIWIYINTTTDKEYIPYVKNLLKRLFRLPIGCHYRKNQDMADLFVTSVDLINYLKNKGLFETNKVKHQADVPQWISSEKSYQKAFLRGFFDTDGSIYQLKFGIQMSFCNRSRPLLNSTRKILLNLGYHPSNVSSFKVYLTRKPELHRYGQEIGFGNPKHLERAKKFGIIH